VRRGAPFALLAAALALPGCALFAPAPREAVLAEAERPTGLRIRLAFGADADLDLYVTDPLQETVYFANTPSASGGRLAEDVTCSDAEPRVETVVFEEPPPGRYRIGIDFPIRCNRTDAPVPWVLEVSEPQRSGERRGEIPFGRYEPIVWELEIGAR
jgi:hypothetical protein